MLTSPRRTIAALAVCGLALTGIPLAATAADPPDPSAPAAVEDTSARVSSSGRLYFVDQARPDTPLRAAVRGRDSRPVQAEAPSLHSLPGSKRTIFLDFDGTTVANTEWNKEGLPNGFYDAWDPAGDGDGFSPSELAMIEEIWEIAAEDFAPFNVDVTTEDPGAAAIDRSGASDRVYGTRVLLTDDPVAAEQLDTFGIAFFDVFDETTDHARLQPVWVLPDEYTMKAVADTVSHEVGHNLALEHDGKGGEEYYEGHDSWGPIMGISDYRPIGQWSNGDYGGTNHEDDVQVIAASGAPLRGDEAGGEIAGAADFPSVAGVITTRSDQDVYALGVCEGTLSVAARPAAASPNLDIKLELLGSQGNVLDSNDPPSQGIDDAHASGLNASISGSLDSPDSLYVRVDGVGRGNPATSYGDYGSIGSYTLTATGCDFSPPPDVAPERPGKPTVKKVKPGAKGGKKTAKVGWRPPGNASAAEVQGYQLRAYRIRRGRVVQSFIAGNYSSKARKAVVRKRSRQRYKFAVRALNEDGYGAWSKRSRAVTLR